MNTEKKNISVSLRRENRILAVQWIYMCESNRQPAVAENFLSVCSILDKNSELFIFAKEIVMLLQENLEKIDRTIDQFTTNWNFSRISIVDLSILRVAVCELLFRNDIPPIVTINEAIEIGKIFSGEESKAFINGVLDRIKCTLSRSLRTASVV